MNQFELHAHARSSGASERSGGGPFRLLLCGDFTGRESRGVRESLLGRKPRRVDRDTLDTFAGFAPSVGGVLADAGGSPLSFRELDDLHPDHLWEQVAAFGRFRQMRRRLLDPEQFAAAATELSGNATDPTGPTGPAGTAEAASEGSGLGGLLDAAIAETSAQTRTGSELVDALLRELVVDRVPATPGQDELVAQLDAAASETMRRMLRAEEYRSLERSWRGVEQLVRRLDTDGPLELWLFDLSRAELVADLAGAEDVRASELWRTLFQPDAGESASRWGAFVVADVAFGASPAQLGLLARCASLAAEARTPCLAGGVEDLAGCERAADLSDPHAWGSPGEEVAGAWDALRARPEAAWLALALPRFLLRAPYGRRSSPIDAFRFEELEEEPGPEAFLWGNGALAAACVLAHQFHEHGWGLTPLGSWELDHLPTPVVRDAAGDEELVPAAEALLPESAVAALRELGFLPLVTVRGTDRVRLGPLTSIAGAPLAGDWA